MNRAVRYLLIFLVLSICFYFLFLGFFGKNGFLYNKSLETMIVQLELEIERKSDDIELLSDYSSYLNSEEGLRDSALSLGYYVAGDHYYLFPNGQLQDSVEITVSDSDIKPFKYFSNINCFILALGMSLFVTVLTLLLDYKKHYLNTETSSNKDKNSNLDNFIQ